MSSMDQGKSKIWIWMGQINDMVMIQDINMRIIMIIQVMITEDREVHMMGKFMGMNKVMAIMKVVQMIIGHHLMTWMQGLISMWTIILHRQCQGYIIILLLSLLIQLQILMSAATVLVITTSMKIIEVMMKKVLKGKIFMTMVLRVLMSRTTIE